jgi:hypothetical protein
MVRWKTTGRSENLEDRRASSPSRGGFGGLGGGLPFPLPTGKGGKGGMAVILVLVLGFVLTQCLGGGGGSGGGGAGGFDIGDILNQLPGGTPQAAPGEDITEDGPDPEQELVDFMNFVLIDVQDAWEREFTEAGEDYPEATLVLFRNAVDTGCGQASSATGPFYCPLDSKVYVDLGFFEELSSQFGAPGDFAQAYVLAHEIGHHVQNVLGINPEVRRLQQEQPDRAPELSIRQELQADCLSGIWAHSAFERDLLEDGDLDEGITAAGAVGDDRIQSSAGGGVNPETWTHGSSEQRIKWFRVGFDTGDTNACDTFGLPKDEL